MLHEEIPDPEGSSPQELRGRYEAELARIVESVGVEEAAAASGVDADRLAALAAGESPTITVEEAAAILGRSEEWPDADVILAESRDTLMLQMSSAVLDVEALEVGLETEGTDLDARTLQQKIEGRREMTLDEYARVYRYVAAQNPY